MTHTEASTLYYVADPMCSWCFGFAPELEVICAQLPTGTTLRHVMGGLAADSDEPMEESTRRHVQQAWHEVAECTGAEFNWDFWTRCSPRRSTYPSCRAVLAAGLQRDDATAAMFAAIQRGYYREAVNPSDLDVLVAIAGRLEPSIDVHRFARDLVSAEVERLLQEEFDLRRELGVRSFPSLVLERGESRRLLLSGHGRASDVLPLLPPVTPT